MRGRQLVAVGAAGALALGAAACGSGSGTSSNASSSVPAGSINGAGSTLAAPVYMQWGSSLKDEGITVNYQAVGSGAGVAQWEAGTSSFAATDPPLKPEELAAAKKKGEPVHVPTVFGAITVSYNLPGVGKGLKLDGPTVADIFLGKVKAWNDPAIARLNPGVKLPATGITVVHRSDASGTTKGFTGFLAASSPQWSKQVGSDKTVKWRTGTGAKGNSGVAAAVKQTQGAVGYVEQAYALQNGFTFAAVRNKSGRFVAPTIPSTSAAGQGVPIPSDLRFTTINSANPSAYPIVSQTFVVVYRDMCKGGVAKPEAQRIARFLDYGLGQGQQVAQQLSSAPLPASLDQKAKAQVAGLRCNGAPLKP